MLYDPLLRYPPISEERLIKWRIPTKLETAGAGEQGLMQSQCEVQKNGDVPDSSGRQLSLSS